MSTVRQLDVRLGHPMAPAWSRVGQTWACGFAFRPGQTTPDDAHALARFFDALPYEEAAAAADALTGTFALVRRDGAPGGVQAFAVADALRSFPVFYGFDGDTLVLTDDPLALARQLGAAPNLDHLPAFLLSGNVLGPNTLAHGIFALQAGERLDVTADGSLQTRRILAYGGSLDAPTPGWGPDALDWDERLVAALDAAFARTTAALRGRAVAVPLSGGLDSRLLVAMLLRHGVRPTLLYTYGRSSSFEARRSRAVADALGLPWHCVPYSASAWHRWGKNHDYSAFCRYASRLVAIEHEQEWPALHALLASGKLPPDTAVLPGHAADFNAGSHLPDDLFADGPYDVPGWILRRYFGLWPRRALGPDGEQTLRQHLATTLDRWPRDADSPARAAHAFEQFGWQERQTKMIGNSVRVYEAFGLTWHLPFWDEPLRRLWPSVPLHLRRQQRLYRRVAEQLLGRLATTIPYRHPAWPRPIALLHTALDSTHRRYGLFLGPHPERTALTRRVADLVRPDDPPIVHALARPWAHLPPQRVPINGLLALQQWQSTARWLSGADDA